MTGKSRLVCTNVSEAVKTIKCTLQNGKQWLESD